MAGAARARPLRRVLLRGINGHAAGTSGSRGEEVASPCPRHVRCCRCATDVAPLTLLVIAVPSSPSGTKGEEGTSMMGGARAVLEDGA